MNNFVDKKIIKKEKIYNLDFLRVLFISGLVVHHFYNVITSKWNNGWLGVPFFFMLSGFFLVYSLNIQQSIIDFVKNKLIRFIPLMFFTSLVVGCLGGSFDVQKLLTELFLFPLTGISNGFGYNHPAWFVAVLFWILLAYFYLLKHFNQSIVNSIVFFVTFTSCIIMAQFDIYSKIRLFVGLGALGIGYFAGTFCLGLPRNTDHKKSILFTFIEACILIFLIILMFSFLNVYCQATIYFLMAFLIILFYLNKGYVSAFFEKAIFSKLSTYVLPVFLTHFILYAYVFKFFIKHYNAFIVEYRDIVCVGAVIVSFVFGAITYYFIQIPVLKSIKSRESLGLFFKVKNK